VSGDELPPNDEPRNPADLAPTDFEQNEADVEVAEPPPSPGDSDLAHAWWAL
jgi:hypothetical protein